MEIRVKMNDVPWDVRPKICELLKKQGREAVTMGYESRLSVDEQSFCVIARLTEPADEFGYSVHSYISKQDRFYREILGRSYGQALIEMGERVVE